ncbi:hypothetical protein GCM10009863_35010 [Streptomyces axinellae]|uniref:Uncharacterized protein n=1 Tax=Streptomyces axinellae TaxID=552788 RepID=A0ABN3Q6K8_9ACTN
MPIDPFRAIAALARAEVNRAANPAPPRPRRHAEAAGCRKPAEPAQPEAPAPPEEPAQPPPRTSARRRTVWHRITARIRRDVSG